MGQRSVNSFPGYMDNKTHTILVGIRHAQEINNQNKDAYLRSLVVCYEKKLVNEHKHIIYANPKFSAMTKPYICNLQSLPNGHQMTTKMET